VRARIVLQPGTMHLAVSRACALAAAGGLVAVGGAKQSSSSKQRGPAHAEGCLADGAPYPEHEGTQLRLVQVLHRHGARTPFVALPGMPQEGTPGWSSLWGQCRLPPKAAVTAAARATENGGGGVPLSGEAAMAAGQAEAAAAATYGTCGKGQLTKLGEEQLMHLGTFLRREYLEGPAGRLLAGGPVPPAEQLAVTSTKTSRTILSVRSMLHGLLPEATDADIEALVKVPRPFSMDILIANYARCDRLRELFHEAKAHVDSSLMSVHTRARLAKEVGAMSQNLTLIAAGDPLRALVGQGAALPGNVSEGLAEELDACGHEMVDVANGRHSAEMRRLSMGLLLADMHEQIMAAADGRSPLRMAVRSAHDISVCGLLAALGLQVPGWPRFGSSVVTELRRDLQSGDFQVRIVCYDGVPGGGDGGKVIDVTVPLQAWCDTVEPLILSEEEYVRECSLPAGRAKPPPQAW